MILIQLTPLQRGFLRRGLDCSLENISVQLLAERGKFGYTRFAKHTVVEHENTAAV